MSELDFNGTLPQEVVDYVDARDMHLLSAVQTVVEPFAADMIEKSAEAHISEGFDKLRGDVGDFDIKQAREIAEGLVEEADKNGELKHLNEAQVHDFTQRVLREAATKAREDAQSGDELAVARKFVARHNRGKR